MRMSDSPDATGRAHVSRMRRAAATLVLVTGLAIPLAPVGAAAPQTTNGLRLLVPSIPPSIVDPETGAAQPVAGGLLVRCGESLARPRAGRRDRHHRPRGERVGGADPPGRICERDRERIERLRGLERERGLDARHTPAGGCTLRLVPGVGRASRVPCGWLVADGGAGAVVGSSRGQVLVDHRTGRELARVTGEGSLAPLHGDLVLENAGSATSAGRNRLSLVHVRGGRRRALRWPSALPYLDGVVAAPHGPLVAVGFAAPGNNPQGADLFLLDTRTGRFRHVPGFPLREDLKWSSVGWSADGRLVMTVRLDGAMRLGVYRPGARATTFSPVTVPPFAGSDAFVLLGPR